MTTILLNNNTVIVIMTINNQIIEYNNYTNYQYRRRIDQVHINGFINIITFITLVNLNE